jgi:hypothetical protein
MQFDFVASFATLEAIKKPQYRLKSKYQPHSTLKTKASVPFTLICG